jgi:hypothetical protein
MVRLKTDASASVAAAGSGASCVHPTSPTEVAKVRQNARNANRLTNMFWIPEVKHDTKKLSG